MGWMGKMVGGGIGFVLGGPLGALAGAAFGHMFDSDENRQVRVDDAGFSPADSGQFTFFVNAFSMLAKIARVDGRVTSAEVNVLRAFMIRDLRLNVQSRVMAEQIFNRALKDNRPLSSFAHQFKKEFRDSPELFELMIDAMMRLAVADGALHRNKEALISSASKIFGLSEAKYRTIRSRHAKAAAGDAYKVLDCSPDDSNETIKKQYRKKVKEYHPDTIASKDLPEDFIAYANNRFREVQEAWDTIRRERGL